MLQQNAFEIDRISTAIRRKNVYNNYLLYDIVKEHTVSKKDHYPLINCTVTSAKYYVANFAELKPNCYLITDPIPIFSDEDEKFYKDANVELDGPPIIYIGRADEGDPDNKVMYFEDIDFNVIINNKKYKPDTPADQKAAREINLHLIQSVLFKPINITTRDFRLLVTKDYEREETSQNQLILRWWAVCKFRFKETL